MKLMEPYNGLSTLNKKTLCDEDSCLPFHEWALGHGIMYNLVCRLAIFLL